MLSIIIPSKSEPYLQKTVEDIKRNAVTNPEILVGIDDDEQIGQRAQMNRMARKARGKYIMKTDAHCSFGPGFDQIMLDDIQDNQIMAPYLLVLDAENWLVRSDKRTSSYVFDSNLVMHYGTESTELINRTMCLQGSCFLTSTENYWNWNLCDESLGSWGGQGSELGIKAYLNGGECVTTKKTYYGHLFRHTEEDFPYKRDMAAIDASHKAIVKKLATQDIAGLVRAYNYPVDWTEEKLRSLPEHMV